MYKKTTIFLILLLLVSYLSGSAFAQDSIQELLYGDLKEIESFGYIFVKVEGEKASQIGIADLELIDFAKLRFKNNFSHIQYQEITAEEARFYQEEENAKRVGSIWFRVWLEAGPDDIPFAYYIECKAGNYEIFDMWNCEVLGIADNQNIHQIVRYEMNRMIEDFAMVFFKVRGEI